MMIMLKVIIFCFLISAFLNVGFATNLADSIIKNEQIVLTVEYQGKYLNVWRHGSHGQSRFYVTPLCIMITNSISCSLDEYSKVHRHIFEFSIKLWDKKAAEAVKTALKQKNIKAKTSDILPIPMRKIRIGLDGKDLIPEANYQWRSYHDQQHVMSFELYTRHKQFCDKMVHATKNNTKHSLRLLKPFLEYAMVEGEYVSKNLTITGETLQKSSPFAALLNNDVYKNGIVYLQFKDLNYMVRKLFNKAAYYSEITDYISSKEEQQVVNEILDILKERKIQSKELTKDEWNLVFWDDIFERPDIQADYANEVLEFDENKNAFKFNAEKDREFKERLEKKYHKKAADSGRSGLLFLIPSIKENGEAAESRDSQKNMQKAQSEIKLEDLQKAMDKDNLNVKWNGTKFEPHDLTLYGLNRRTFNPTTELYFKRIIVNKHQGTQKIEITSENPLHYSEENGQTIIIFNNTSDSLYSSCPTPLIYFQPTHSCYGIHSWNVTTRDSWKNGEKYCVEKYKGHLVSIHSRQEFLFVRNIMSNMGTYVSTGLYSDDNGISWKWTDDSPVDYELWSKGYPKKENGTCTFMGDWMKNDDCNIPRRALCKVKL